MGSIVQNLGPAQRQQLEKAAALAAGPVSMGSMAWLADGSAAMAPATSAVPASAALQSPGDGGIPQGSSGPFNATQLHVNIPIKQEPTELLGKIGVGVYRFGKMALIWKPYGLFADIWQHEFFGHGFRIRSSDSIYATSYHVNLPPPYEYGGGSTGFRYNETCKIVTFNAVDFGGTEARQGIESEPMRQFVITNLLFF